METRVATCRCAWFPGRKIAYAKLWPHARPWRLGSAEPMLRDLPDAAVVGPLLSRMLAAQAPANETPVQQTPDTLLADSQLPSSASASGELVGQTH